MIITANLSMGCLNIKHQIVSNEVGCNSSSLALKSIFLNTTASKNTCDKQFKGKFNCNYFCCPYQWVVVREFINSYQ